MGQHFERGRPRVTRGNVVAPEADLRTIAAELGISHQATSQILDRALGKARRVLEARGIDSRAFFDAMERESRGDGL